MAAGSAARSAAVTGRDAVLAAVRRGTRRTAAHPGPHPSPALPATAAAFAAQLAAAAGEAHGPIARAELAKTVEALAAAWAAGGRVVAEPSAAALLAGARFEIAAAGATPASYADVAVAIATGAVGVAESGAVAVLGRDAPHRSLLFLAERVILLLDAARLVADMHAGLRALPPDALAHHHVTWIAGPSKTADIEQALVLGAHGPRALAVFLYDAAARTPTEAGGRLRRLASPLAFGSLRGNGDASFD
jgi:L-lactate dehydrogenase complex protein LldG